MVMVQQVNPNAKSVNDDMDGVAMSSNILGHYTEVMLEMGGDLLQPQGSPEIHASTPECTVPAQGDHRSGLFWSCQEFPEAGLGLNVVAFDPFLYPPQTTRIH